MMTPTLPLVLRLLLLICLVCAPLSVSYASSWMEPGETLAEKSYCLSEEEAKLLTKGIQKKQMEVDLLNLEIEELNSQEHTTYYVETATAGFVAGLLLGLTILIGGI